MLDLKVQVRVYAQIERLSITGPLWKNPHDNLAESILFGEHDDTSVGKLCGAKTP